MRKTLVVLCILLAGCGGKGTPSLAPYTIGEDEAPAGLSLIPYDDEDWGFFFVAAGMESNPGSVSAKALQSQGVENVTAGYLAMYETQDGSGFMLSAATRFTSAEAASWYLLQEFECSDPVVLIQNGPIVAVAFMDGLDETMQEEVRTQMELVRVRTGSATPC